jgi:bacillithiol system protein YtxJ
MPMVAWRDARAIEEALKRGVDGCIFKHSTRCEISAQADREVAALAAELPDLAVYRVLVVEDRPVSNAITAALEVPHASPQAILLREGRPVWVGSHWDITREALRQAWLGSATPAPGEGRRAGRDARGPGAP